MFTNQNAITSTANINFNKFMRTHDIDHLVKQINIDIVSTYLLYQYFAIPKKVINTVNYFIQHQDMLNADTPAIKDKKKIISQANNNANNYFSITIRNQKQFVNVLILQAISTVYDDERFKEIGDLLETKNLDLSQEQQIILNDYLQKTYEKIIIPVLSTTDIKVYSIINTYLQIYYRISIERTERMSGRLITQKDLDWETEYYSQYAE